MENNEKKVIQISLSQFIILIVLLIILICVGVGLYVSALKKSNTESEIQAINEQENIIENMLNNVNNVVANEEQVNSNKETTTDTPNEKSVENNKNLSFTESEIKECIQNYLDLVGAKAGSPSNLLVKLNLLSYDDTAKSKGSATSDGYVKTNVAYSTYKSKMMNYVTEEWFNKHFTDCFKNQNGLLLYFDGGATGMELEVKEITLKGIYSDYTYIAKVNNIAIDDSVTEENVEFHIDSHNGKCVISYCDY